MKASDGVKAALRAVDEHFEEMKRTLLELARIPGVSAPGFPAQEVRRSAEAFADLLRRVGLENVQLLEVPGVHPYVYGDWIRRPGAPTVLLYGHHDVVPPGRPERWVSPPFEPVERKGRLYGRGTADDKGGILVHVSAVAAYLRSDGSLPCNVKFLIEGEEEIGSENLATFLDRYKELMAADAVVLSDTANFDTGVPGLTYRLRGLCQVDVEVRCLERPVHSGQRGGIVPDPVQILCRLIADLTAKDGSLNIPGLYRRVAKTTARRRARLRRLPFDAGKLAHQTGLLPGVKLTPLHAHGPRHGLPRGGRAAGTEAHEDTTPRRASRCPYRPDHALVADGPRGPGVRGGASSAPGRVREGGCPHGRGRVHRIRAALLGLPRGGTLPSDGRRGTAR